MAEKSNAQNSAKPEANKFNNPIDPIYLHHSDQPGLILVIQLLNEENYNTWSCAMVMALSIKNKERFINSTIKEPLETSIEEFQQWKRCNNLVRAWIFNSILPYIRASIIYINSAH